MSARFRFAAALAIALALLIAAAWFIVRETTGGWFEKDVGLRANLAVNGARRALLSDIESGDTKALENLLADISRDERVMGVALCTSDMERIAATPNFPEAFGCRAIGRHVRPHANAPAPSWTAWRTTAILPGGPIQVNAIPLIERDKATAFAILVHDLSFAARREASTQVFLLSALGILAVLASAVTLVVVRYSWRNWSATLHRMARGQEAAPRREFLPVIKDLRELLDRLAAEEQAELHGGAWTPERLKLTLNRHLHGERLVVVANREPYIHDRGPDGKIRVLHPASGLVSALEPVLRACSGVWVAHGAGSADRETSDRHGRVRVPPGEESYLVRRVWLSPEEEKGYYYGLANEGLWPLCHVSHTRPIFRAEDWQQYRTVNERFVQAVCEEVDTDDPVILVQDYHFALAPRLLRERLPRATIIMFWHIPWPNAEQISICPWHRELIEGMLGSSILGFHTQFHCNNFMDAADRFLESRLDREDLAVIQENRRTLVRSYPISIEWPHHWASAAPSTQESRRLVFEELDLPLTQKLGVGVDRLDYTKGIEERMRAIEKLLEQHPELHGRFTFLQIASPSRSEIASYAQLKDDVEALVGRINGRFGRDGWQPIILRRRHTEPVDVFRYYRAADVCYVSSLHDGMNLVAKEFVAARDDEQGVLVLSQFAGASRELTEALIVNPYDIEQASRALAIALTMSPKEQQARMSAMRKFVAEFNVYRWAGRMLLDASRLRRREQLADLLAEHNLHGANGSLP
ncbi:trehalose-6-phosphate synthase [Lysobacter niabensis]|uniref:alpha,alpha-trehalose-phosphate synthase (UDP-forming) n=1 Tax=Agrilutibacter niabensis TaxID=380628 RepID=UPI00360CB415